MPLPGGPPALNLHEALARNTGFLLTRMGMVAAREFAERIAEVGVTPRGWGALNVLETEGAVTQQRLGTCIGMDPSSMVATIDELEAQGLVERRRNPQDRRAHALHITDQGRRTLAAGRKIARRAQEDLLAPLSAEERRHLHDLLLRLAAKGGSEPTGGRPPRRAQATAATSSERASDG